MTKKLLDMLNRFMRAVIDEAEQNEEFSRRLEQAFCVDSVQTKTEERISRSHSRRRDPAVINPVDIIEGGEDILREKLDTLTEKELKDIIAFYGMDSTKLSMKWKKRDRLINFIIETSRRRASKGDAFR